MNLSNNSVVVWNRYINIEGIRTSIKMVSIIRRLEIIDILENDKIYYSVYDFSHDENADIIKCGKLFWNVSTDKINKKQYLMNGTTNIKAENLNDIFKNSITHYPFNEVINMMTDVNYKVDEDVLKTVSYSGLFDDYIEEHKNENLHPIILSEYINNKL